MTDLMLCYAPGVLVAILAFLLFQTPQFSLITRELWHGQVVAARNKNTIDNT
jgi:hypothetical protein